MSTFRDSRALPVPDGWAHHLEAWRVALVAAGRSPRTIRTRLEHLEHVARAMGGDVAGVSAARLIAWAGAQRWAAETRRSHYASLRGFFAWAHGVGVIAVVQDLLGHASPVTTRIYVPRNLGRMRAAVVAASA